MRIKPHIFSVICKVWILGSLCIGVAYAFTGYIDKREYVNWADHPFNKYVHMGDYCTAQFVGPDLILTAAHCLDWGANDINKQTYDFSNYKGESFQATVIKHGDYNAGKLCKDRQDWALLRISDSKYHTSEWFEIEVPKEGTVLTVDNAGWGALKILSIEEIDRVRKAFTEHEERRRQQADTVGNYKAKCSTAELRSKNELECEILEEAYGCNASGCAESETYTPEALRSFVTRQEKKIGIEGLLEDQNRLKVHRGCRVIADKKCVENGTCGLWLEASENSNMPYVLPSDCDDYGGNSGGAFLHNGMVVATVSCGADQTNNNQSLYVVSALQFADVVSDALKTSPKVENKNKTAISDISNIINIAQQSSIPDNATETLTGYEAEINRLESQIQNAMKIPTSQMSDKQLLQMLDKMASLQRLDKLKENAQKMKDREQSTANKILGAAAIGATGIGAMNLMSGLAEQSADEDAERDMKAYLATFVCDYGQGRNIKGGEVNIELPGGNDLIALVSEYKALAADLKTRKEALGLRSGIESEIIFDAAETGLYDDVGIGRQSGAFTSLSRALTDENSADAQAWAKQKSDAASKVKTGAITAAVGAVGGLVGNLAINTGKNKPKEESDKINREYEKDREELLRKLRSETVGYKDESLQQALEAVKQKRASYVAQINNARSSAIRQCDAASGHMNGNLCECRDPLKKNPASNKCEIPRPENTTPTNSASRYLTSVYTTGLFELNPNFDPNDPSTLIRPAGSDEKIKTLAKTITDATAPWKDKEDIFVYLVGHTWVGLEMEEKDEFTEFLAWALGQKMFGDSYEEHRLAYRVVGMGAGCATPNPSETDAARDNRVDVYIMFGTDSLYGLDLCKPGENI